MAVLPTTSTCLDLTISFPGFASSPSLNPSTAGDQGGGGGGNVTLRDFDINQVPEGGEEEEWATGSMELEGEDDDDDNNGQPGGGGSGSGGPPPKKLRLTKQQSRLLEESFRQNHTLNPKQKEALAMELTLKPRQVEVWFQNRRARSKLKQTEMECEYLKRWFGSLTEQNRKLQKEVEELRAMKVGPPTVISPTAASPSRRPRSPCALGASVSPPPAPPPPTTRDPPTLPPPPCLPMCRPFLTPDILQQLAKANQVLLFPII